MTKIFASYCNPYKLLSSTGERGITGDRFWSTEVRLQVTAIAQLINNAMDITRNVGYQVRVSVMRLAEVIHINTR